MIQQLVRRVFPILLMMVLAPSIATASLYRCVYDGITRTSCCCPTGTTKHKKEAPSQDASVRSACCCTVTQVTTTAPTARANESISVDLHLPVVAVAFSIAPAPRAAEVVCRARPRAQGDPPDTLLARRCSLLL